MAVRRSYMVIFERGEHCFGGLAPDVPGVFSTGRTLKKMRAMMKEALEFGLSSMLCDGEPIPEAKTTNFDFKEFIEMDGASKSFVVEWLEVRISKKANRNAKKIEPGHSMHQAALLARKTATKAA